MLKNEVKKKTTTRPSAPRAGPKWTTHGVPVRFCIKAILEHKQIANKHPAATQCVVCVCFDFSKQRRHCNSVIANASFEYGFRVHTKTNFSALNIRRVTSCVSKCVSRVLSVFACELEGKA